MAAIDRPLIASRVVVYHTRQGANRGWADVTGLPWTEIDFVEDLRRAEEAVLPLIEALRDS